MYIPSHYLIEDQSEALEFMKRYSFACIITCKDNFPLASHLPFLIDEIDGKVILSAHFAKANPQWKEIESAENLVIFQEPHAYISPSLYDQKPAVPTWDYVSVHAYGKAKIMEGEGVIEKLIVNFEEAFLHEWRSFPDDYRNRMLNGIVAFEIEVSRLEAKKKLNQSSSDADRARIIARLEDSEKGSERDLAEYIRKQ